MFWPLIHNKVYRAKSAFRAVKAGMIVRFDCYRFSRFEDSYYYNFCKLPSEEKLEVVERRGPEVLLDYFEAIAPEPYERSWEQPFPFDLCVETQMKVLGIGADETVCAQAPIRYLAFRGDTPSCFFHDHRPSDDWPIGSSRPRDQIDVRLGEVVRCDPNVLAGLPRGAGDVLYRDGASHPWKHFSRPYVLF
jgi:hypothetical protein